MMRKRGRAARACCQGLSIGFGQRVQGGGVAECPLKRDDAPDDDGAIEDGLQPLARGFAEQA